MYVHSVAIVTPVSPKSDLLKPIGPRSEKTGLRGF